MDVDDDLVEVRVILIELLEAHMLILLENFLLDATASSRVLFFLLSHELGDGVFEAGLVLLDPNLLQVPHHQILENVLEPLRLDVILAWLFLLQVVRHDHDVVKWDAGVCLQPQHSLLFEESELPLEIIMLRQ